MSDTPTAPPMVRENWFNAVAAPRLPQSTLVWTTISSGAVNVPMPAPMISVAAPVQTHPRLGDPSASIRLPASKASAPATTRRWYPTRTIRNPEMDDITGQPSDIAPTATPAW